MCPRSHCKAVAEPRPERRTPVPGRLPHIHSGTVVAGRPATVGSGIASPRKNTAKPSSDRM